VSSDRDAASFHDYYKDMPWLALDYSDRKTKDELAKKFHVSGIPMLILLDGDSGSVICSEARGKIQFDDLEGANFPWKST
jgi:nucleoredoxin